MSRKNAAILVLVTTGLTAAGMWSIGHAVKQQREKLSLHCATPDDLLAQFEQARTPDRVRGVLQPAAAPQCGGYRRAVLDAENHADLAFLVFYSLLNAAIFVFLTASHPDHEPLRRAPALRAAGLVLAAVMLASDALEDWRLLELTRPGAATQFLLRWCWASNLKWLALIAAAALVAGLYLLDDRRRPGNLMMLLAAPYAAAAVCGLAALGAQRSTRFAPFVGLLAVAWSTTALQAAASLVTGDALQALKEAWKRWKPVWEVLWTCRFSAAVVLLVTAALAFSPQGQDIMQSLAESKAAVHPGYFIPLFIYGLASWYAARVAVYFRPLPARLGPNLGWLVEWIPRLIGCAVFVGAAGAVLHVAFRYNDLSGASAFKAFQATNDSFRILLIGSLVLIAPFLAVVVIRRIVLNAVSTGEAGAPPEGRSPGETQAPGETVAGAHPASPHPPTSPAPDAHLPGQVEPEARRLQIFNPGYGTVSRRAPTATLAAIFGVFFFAILVFLLFWLAPNALGPFFGSAAVIFLAAATWLPFGTLLAHVGLRHGLPLLTVLMLATIPFGGLNDNHRIRLEGQAPPTPSTIGDHLRVWAKFMDDKEGKRPHPLVVVAAEGGGSLSAYWTAMVLSKLQDDSVEARGPVFADHVFAVSGISGGSLGAATFAALAAERNKFHEKIRFTPLATRFLSRDFLSPILSMMLFPEFLQKLLPVPISDFDRSRAIEQAWEEGWRYTLGNDTPSNRFALPFTDLFVDAKKAWVPRLVLNSTWIESGNRALITPFQQDDRVFVDSSNLLEQVGADLPLSAAVHDSARFPYVNPPGTVVDAQGKALGHLIDGGLFEASGASAAFELVEEILRIRDHVDERAEPELGRLGRILVVLASGTPTLQGSVQETPGESGLASLAGERPATEQPPPDLARWQQRRPTSGVLLGPLAPPKALIASRGARGTWALLNLYKLPADKVSVYQFGMCTTVEDGRNLLLPVSWELSDLAQHTMCVQLDGGCNLSSNPSDPNQGFDNPKQQTNLFKEFGVTWPPSPAPRPKATSSCNRAKS
jgi:hypothetical protein